MRKSIIVPTPVINHALMPCLAYHTRERASVIPAVSSTTYYVAWRGGGVRVRRKRAQGVQSRAMQYSAVQHAATCSASSPSEEGVCWGSWGLLGGGGGVTVRVCICACVCLCLGLCACALCSWRKGRECGFRARGHGTQYPCRYVTVRYTGLPISVIWVLYRRRGTMLWV